MLLFCTDPRTGPGLLSTHCLNSITCIIIPFIWVHDLNHNTLEKYQHEETASNTWWRSLHEEGPPHVSIYKIHCLRPNKSVSIRINLRFLLFNWTSLLLLELGLWLDYKYVKSIIWLVRNITRFSSLQISSTLKTYTVNF